MEQKHAASPKKLRDARKKGQVSKSQDLLRLAGLAFVFELAHAFQEPVFAAFTTLFDNPIEWLRLPFDEALERVLSHALVIFCVVVFSVMGGLILVKILVSWLQTGFVFSTQSLTPSFNRLNPGQQLGQMFSANKLWDLLTGIIKILLIAGLGFMLIRNRLADIFGMSSLSAMQLWDALQALFMPLIRALLGLLVGVSVADVAMQRYFYKKRLRMSEQELKQEKKSQDGDPHLKSKRKSVAQQLLMAPAKSDRSVVKQANVVVVNPTHIAIALSYQPEESALPVVIYKDVDEGALKTIEYARSENIPVIRFLWLARTLHSSTPVGAPIPRESIQAVAAVFRVLKQLADESLSRSEDGIYTIDDN